MVLRILLILLIVTPVFLNNASALLNTAKVTVKVVDEAGEAIAGAKVGVGFNYNTGWGTNTKGAQGMSDEKGIFSAVGEGNGYVSYGANKNGYYNSSYSYEFQKQGVLGWEPHNPELKIVLRKIANPVPMYARDMRESMIEIPVADEKVGFDLVRFDWVAPYGSGVNSDFIFHLKRRVADWKNFDSTLTITFASKHDGIQPYYEDLQFGSDFKLPRFAPKSGYQNNLVLHEWRSPGDGKVQRNFDFVKKDLNYIFRIRTQEEGGNITHAMYGKIHKFIGYSAVHSATAKIYFKYYLNPDGTGNLEYDPKQNLFTNLPPREWVGIK